jgi:hypothetical protein
MSISHLWGCLLVLVLAAWLNASPPEYLHCRCGFGSAKARSASIAYGLIALRSMVALLFRQRTWGWCAHLFLMHFIPEIDCGLQGGRGLWGGRKKGTRVKVTEESGAAICAMFLERQSMATIARTIGLTRKTVYAVFERRGLATGREVR